MKIMFVVNLLLGTLIGAARYNDFSQVPVPAAAPSEKEAVLSEGTVVFFDSRKGAGFIQPASSSKKIFVHASDTKERIKANQKVTYVTTKDKKGERAVEVEVKQP